MDIFVTHQTKCEPNSWEKEGPGSTVQNDIVVVSYFELIHGASEKFSRWLHVRQTL